MQDKMIDISVNESFIEFVNPGLLQTTATTALQTAQFDSPTELTIAIENDELLRSLNLQFLGIDAPTDVLSFPADEIDPDTGNTYLGDIIISFPRAKFQADHAGHSVEAEIRLLVIHGVLHLLGYDHSTAEEKQEMWTVQSQLIQAMAVEIKQLPED